MTASQPDSTFAVLPDPGQAGTLDEDGCAGIAVVDEQPARHG
jgi:hypothetical protein